VEEELKKKKMEIWKNYFLDELDSPSLVFNYFLDELSLDAPSLVFNLLLLLLQKNKIK
jgi:hypothetical protein